MKIIGYTVGTTLPKPNLAQTDPKKGDYVKGKEILDEKYIKIDEQELTEEQKTQVRTNMNAASKTFVDELSVGVDELASFVLSIDYNTLTFDTTEIVFGTTTNTTSSILGKAILGSMVLG